MDPEIEYLVVDGPNQPLDRTRRDGRWLARLAESLGDFRAEPEKYREIDGDRILVLVRNCGRGRTGGLELEQRSAANLFGLRDGKVTRLVSYLERENAFADVGLTPDTRDPYSKRPAARNASS